MIHVRAVPAKSTSIATDALPDDRVSHEGGVIWVVAGVLRDLGGRVLVSQRAPGKHLAGAWEFPGGKREEGESRRAALVREFEEELGVRVEDARPLITIPYCYAQRHDPHSTKPANAIASHLGAAESDTTQSTPAVLNAGRNVILDVWEIVAANGRACSREGQAIAWHHLAELAGLTMPAADLPILDALRLPSRYVITPPAATPGEVMAGLRMALDHGERLLQLRLPCMAQLQLQALIDEIMPLCRRAGTRVLLNCDWELAMRAGLDGVHLPARIAATMSRRPLPADLWLGVSCHDAAELAHAVRIGADFVTLSPVAATPDHASAELLGWSGFAALANACPLPVFALGGVGQADVAWARNHGAQGIAGIRGLWPGTSPVS